jgi:RNA polymerase sigma-B factor
MHDAHHDAHGELIATYLPVADRIARRYAHHRDQLDDLVQVARLGLVKAVNGFDPRLGPFLGYAVPTIEGELKRYFRDQCWRLRPPRRLQELRAAARTAEEELAQRLGRPPTVAETAERVGCPPADLAEALQAAGHAVASLNAPVRGAGDGPELGELGELLGGTDPDLDSLPDRMSLRPALALLPDRERRVIGWRFVDQLTQRQIAERLGISQIHVSRLLARTLAGLRAWIDGERDEVEVCQARRRAAVS